MSKGKEQAGQKDAKGVKSVKDAKDEVLLEKSALLESRRYRSQRDLLAVLLEDGKQYSLAQVDACIQKFNRAKSAK